MDAQVIFDVGAHIGITALEFFDQFPRSTIYAFEPSSSNFEKMKANLVGASRVKMLHLGLGEKPGKLSLAMDPVHPSMARISSNQLLPYHEEVQIDTVDGFCTNNSLDAIDIMKIDTEGYEISVLAGAVRMLSSHSIGIVKAEVALDPDSSYHTALDALSDHLHRHGYRLFGFYDQSEDPLSRGPRIRRFDVAFISPSLFAS
ncbi:FkbM family methyltransferase [Bradyrhizobium roseum]|uniref:FkbM family methyltransferase n=1 Tax=Bradyrhizobium roseum TaxID=3056648 RepID=UPI002617E5D1|nr:FkbM family methyltransferase [Bradyrhizobium roseus]WKA30620.1 FkbM family methyltransferase [Bradyrhizobium roseus]